MNHSERAELTSSKLEEAHRRLGKLELSFPSLFQKEIYRGKGSSIRVGI
jgi:hypothetical protein